MPFLQPYHTVDVRTSTTYQIISHFSVDKTCPLLVYMCRLGGWLSWRHASTVSLPGIGFVSLLTGAQHPWGLHRCSQTTAWWSFIADSSVSKSLLLSSLFWFMYSLIYLCMSLPQREGRKGGGEQGVEKGRQWQLQYFLLYPGESLHYICFLAQTSTAAESYRAPTPTPCMFCMLKQKGILLICALSLWRGLNAAAYHCGNYKNQKVR